MFLVQINDFVLIEMDTLSLYSHGIPVAQSRESFSVSIGSVLEQTVWLQSSLWVNPLSHRRKQW